MISKSKYRSLEGALLTRRLFVEFGLNPSTLYTLKEVPFTGPDGKVYPSLYQAYVDMEDPVEWEFGNRYFESYHHWTRIRETPWMSKLLERWREDVEVKIKANALKSIQATALSEGKNSYEANKLLVTGGWKERVKEVANGKRGRPSKAEVQAMQARALEEHQRQAQDLERLRGLIKPTSTNKPYDR